jgi:predicted  nucleic acid-binding Zn-ribbon protein
LDKAKSDLGREAENRQRVQEENQRLRRSLAEITETVERLKAGREVLEEHANKRADGLARANETLLQEFKEFKAAVKRGDKPGENWASRLFSPRKKPTDH